MRNKKILMLVFVVAFLTLLVGCYPSVPVKLIGIKVSPETITTSIGGTLQLEVTALYDDGDHGDITSKCIYSSSDSFIVVVDSYEGLVIAKALGEATITVAYISEGIAFTDTAEVTVREDIVEQETI